MVSPLPCALVVVSDSISLARGLAALRPTWAKAIHKTGTDYCHSSRHVWGMPCQN
ncbi:hypothetical protein PR003_g33976 [Phytophthora rubi]|uniref:Uncharacterized protein n=1 Tax=Phytophthora rubi TaxID=129364 RepID=A0A6A3J066_9STRA|nr:hypothetical protein PR002_g32691 [Phytophthora rubi]KAE8987582.1 hypothetical protein PR001_g22283 [Phytophthora rubi]KAE9261324.1 hypothetical protein PR003_g33976 [Phytophthora rubi]